MATFEDLYDVLPPCGVFVSRLCPCLAFLLKPQHADREVETVSLMGSARSREPDPDTDHVPSAAAELWFQKMQAGVYRGESRRRALGRSPPIPQPTPQPQKSPKAQPQEQPQPQKSPKPQPQEQPQPQKSPKAQPQEQPQPQKSPKPQPQEQPQPKSQGKLRAAPRLIRAGSSIESTGPE
jgi:outer membrane biosynthesis protein TonB